MSAVRSLGYTQLGTTGSTMRIITDRAEWFELLADEFALMFDGVDTDAKGRLWASACASHEAWMASKAEAEAEADVSAADADDADASARGSG